jgi:hypothetical protein
MIFYPRIASSFLFYQKVRFITVNNRSVNLIVNSVSEDMLFLFLLESAIFYCQTLGSEKLWFDFQSPIGEN